MELSRIKEYYDLHSKRKIEDFVNGNSRIERAYQEIKTWFVNNPKDVLEIGCGIGTVANRLAKIYPDTNFKAFDISSKSIEIAKLLFQNQNLNYFFANEINEVVFPQVKFFDIIYLIDVFEHLQDESRGHLCDFINARLAVDGIVFMSCPTPSHQNWLRNNKPEGLQPVDFDIHLDDLINFGNKIGRRVLYYKEICVWNEGDYLHVVLGTRSLTNKVKSNNLEKKVGIKKAFSNKIDSFLNKSQMEKNKRIKHVSQIIPDFEIKNG